MDEQDMSSFSMAGMFPNELQLTARNSAPPGSTAGLGTFFNGLPFGDFPRPSAGNGGTDVLPTFSGAIIQEMRALREQTLQILLLHQSLTKDIVEMRKELKITNDKASELAKGPVDYELLVFDELERSEHPNAIFWTEAEWRADKKTKASAGVTRSARSEKTKEPSTNYLTDATGMWIGSTKAHLVKKHVRRLFSAIESDSREKTPLTWDRNASIRQRNFFRISLERKFPFLTLCADGWKVEQLAKDLYPGYRQNRPLGKKTTAASEQVTQTNAGTQAIDATPTVSNEPFSSSSTQVVPDESPSPSSTHVSNELLPPPSTTNKRPAEGSDSIGAAPKRPRLLIQFADPLADLDYEPNVPTNADDTEDLYYQPPRPTLGTPQAVLQPAEPSEPSPTIPPITIPIDNQPPCPSNAIVQTAGSGAGCGRVATPAPVDAGPDSELSRTAHVSPPNDPSQPPDSICPNTSLQLQAAGTSDESPGTAGPSGSGIRANADIGHTNASKPPKRGALKRLVIKEGARNTARTLCAREWLETHEDGLESEFSIYWKTLPAAKAKLYKDRARTHKP